MVKLKQKSCGVQVVCFAVRGSLPLAIYIYTVDIDNFTLRKRKCFEFMFCSFT